MEPSVAYSSVSQVSEHRDDRDDLVDDDDEDETPESLDYSNAMHNVIVKKPKGLRRRQFIVSALVLLLLVSVAVGMAFLILHWISSSQDTTTVPAGHQSPTMMPTQVSITRSSGLSFTVTSSSPTFGSLASQTTSSGSAAVSVGTTTVPTSTPTPSPFAVCWKGDSDCPVCPSGHRESFTSFIWLANNSEIVESVNRSRAIMRSVDNSNVLEYRPLFALHTTLNYFCCHTSEEKRKIVEVLGNQTWTPKNITYDAVSCNVDHNNITVYMLALLSNSSQDYLFNFVRRIERDVTARGVVVNNPRKQPFHLTLALVDHWFPVDDTVTRLHHDIPVFGSMLFDRFRSEAREYRPLKFR